MRGTCVRTGTCRMSGTAIIYASSLGGHVAATARYMAGELEADVFDLKKQTKINLSSYDRVIIGTGIHAGKPYGKVVSFVKDNRNVLGTKKTSLFICCLYKDSRGDAQCEKVSKSLGIDDAAYFPDGADTDENGVKKDVASFIQRLKA